jgi:hypothetical protein
LSKVIYTQLAVKTLETCSHACNRKTETQKPFSLQKVIFPRFLKTNPIAKLRKLRKIDPAAEDQTDSRKGENYQRKKSPERWTSLILDFRSAGFSR